MRTKLIVLGSIALALVFSSTVVMATDDLADVKEQIKKLQVRLDELDKEELGTLHKEEMSRLMKEILQDAQMQPAMPAWMKNLKFSGDFRLQYEHIHINGRNGPKWPVGDPAGIRQPKDRNRIRMSLRFGFTKTWWDKQMEVGFRLVTGSATSEPWAGNVRVWSNPDGSIPTTTLQTMTGTFSKKPVWFDLMYAKYKPKWAKGLTITGGKMFNPFKTKTLMMWDADINPEGLTLHYQAPFFGDFKPYTAFGFWMIEENALSPDAGDTLRDVTLWTYELGLDWQINQDMAYFFGVTYYQFDHMDATTYYIPTAGVDGAWRNAMGFPAVDYSLVEMTTRFKWKMLNLPWQAWFSWVHNYADDYTTRKWAASDRHFQDDPDAYGMGIKVGKNKKKGDWSTSYTYLWEEYASVIRGFTDGFFGGPNRKGHILRGKYNIDDFLTISCSLFLSDPIHTNDNNINFSNHNLDQTTTFQLDLIWKF